MNTKLTLKLDQNAIEKAKLYARRRGVSLSRMVEGYFRGLTRDADANPRELTGVVAELAGVLAGKDVDVSEQAYADHLVRKHS
ncbi:MAG: antitoxin [Acidobacteria bacterium]|nr:antitoxin [Acidobacteriota bacterium]